MRWIGPPVLLIWASILSFDSGCDSRQNGAAPASATTTVSAGATTSASTRPVEPAVLIIDGHPYCFPVATLRVQQKDAAINAELVASDPAGLEENNIYLQLVLDVEDAEHWTAAEWQFKAASQERQETPLGIFLADQDAQLQPYQLRVRIDRKGAMATLDLTGDFLRFDGPGEDHPRTIRATGQFTAAVVEK